MSGKFGLMLNCVSIVIILIGLIEDEANSRAMKMGKSGRKISIQPDFIFNVREVIGNPPKIVSIFAGVNFNEILFICSRVFN